MAKKSGIFIYKPEGKAQEYSSWACNLYNGCSNECEYCYNRHGQANKLLGKKVPTIKRHMSEDEAVIQFRRELLKWREDIIADGSLHFNFVSDPCLPETYRLNLRCIKIALENCVPVQILTKMSGWITSDEWRELIVSRFLDERRNLIKFGFTLTGCDDLEPGADFNKNRINAMRVLKNFGYKTWASIEPIISIPKSLEMILDTIEFCDEYKIGINSLKKDYTPEQVKELKETVDDLTATNGNVVMWKESVINYIKKVK